MTTNRRPLVRTPRRRKVWAGTVTTLTLAGGGNRGSVDLLESYKTDTGVSELAGVTVMRVIGHVRLIWRAAATTPAAEVIRWGIGWVNAGTPSITEPMAPGMREAEWVCQETLYGTEAAAGIQNQSADSPDAESMGSYRWCDSRQMRRQPTPNADFMFVADPTYDAWEANTMGIEVFTQVMLALP